MTYLRLFVLYLHKHHLVTGLPEEKIMRRVQISAETKQPAKHDSFTFADKMTESDKGEAVKQYREVLHKKLSAQISLFGAYRDKITEILSGMTDLDGYVESVSNDLNKIAQFQNTMLALISFINSEKEQAKGLAVLEGKLAQLEKLRDEQLEKEELNDIPTCSSLSYQISILIKKFEETQRFIMSQVKDSESIVDTDKFEFEAMLIEFAITLKAICTEAKTIKSKADKCRQTQQDIDTQIPQCKALVAQVKQEAATGTRLTPGSSNFSVFPKVEEKKDAKAKKKEEKEEKKKEKKSKSTGLFSSSEKPVSAKSTETKKSSKTKK